MTTENRNSWQYQKFAIFVTALALAVWNAGGISGLLNGGHGPADTAMFIGAIVFVGWLSLPTRDKPPGEQSVDNGLALRLGKSLKRILRPLKG